MSRHCLLKPKPGISIVLLASICCCLIHGALAEKATPGKTQPHRGDDAMPIQFQIAFETDQPRHAIVETYLAAPEGPLTLLALNSEDKPTGEPIPCQRSTSGTLLFALPEPLPGQQTQSFRLEAAQPEQAPVPLITLKDNILHNGQESWRIETPAGTWFYHKVGGGFASLFDADGNDWISHCEDSGPRGQYRGLPNLAYPESMLHPGCEGSESVILEEGPVRVSIRSRAAEGAWEVVWHIFPLHARLEVLAVAHPYWVLYEGTPGGRIQTSTQIVHRSDGWTGPMSKRWEKRLPHPGWAAFADPATDRQFLMLRHEPDGETDLYWPMAESMTVFGFGRHDRPKPVSTLKRVPALYSVALFDGTSLEKADQAARRLLDTPSITTE